MTQMLEKFTQKFGMSREMYEANSQITAGVIGSSRIPYPFPVYVESAQGALKWDLDGNELVDFVMGSGALLTGHDHPAIIDALRDRLGKGIHTLANPTALQWAKQVKSMIPSAERVRFTSSGTESTYLALRLARAYSGKTKIVKFKNHFHGWHDYVTPFSGLNTTVAIPNETLDTVVVLEPRIDEVERVLENDNDIAAVILEPTGGHWGNFPLPNPGFLRDLRMITEKHKVVMIMDEVITGFRISKGGAQERFGVLPDLTTMSKIAAGGTGAGVVAGKADILNIMSSTDPTNLVINTGTFTGSPLNASAGLACLKLIESEPINERADAMADRLKRGLTEALIKMEVAGHIHGIASIVHVILGVECHCGGGICTLPHDQIDRATTPNTRNQLRMAMLNEGVDMMAGLGFMVSSAHNEEQIDFAVSAFERSLAILREEGVVT